jgi:hypothetical protein
VTVRPTGERDDSQHLAVGAGAPADPDPLAEGSAAALTDDETDSAGEPVGTPGPDGPLPSPDDVVQAVADFVEDLGTGHDDEA